MDMNEIRRLSGIDQIDESVDWAERLDKPVAIKLISLMTEINKKMTMKPPKSIVVWNGNLVIELMAPSFTPDLLLILKKHKMVSFVALKRNTISITFINPKT